jgi:tetratricopeptide (TPR) repeat protein
MRVGLVIVCALLSQGVVTCRADGPARTGCNADLAGPAAREVLREAAAIVLKQKHQHWWSDHTLRQLADVQIRAGDFDGALRSVRARDGQNAGGLIDLVEAIARSGNRKLAFDVLQFPSENKGQWQDVVRDGVQLRWIEYLIASDDLDRARQAIGQLKTKDYRPHGLRKLAAAYGRAGDAARAVELFALALAAGADFKYESNRASALWETADAQLSVGQAAAAKETIRRLAEGVEWKDPWVKFSALREAAVLAAKARDEQTARHLFRRALAVCGEVDGRQKLDALSQLAKAAAAAGYIDDALKTARMIKHSETDFSQDSPREQALYAIAVAQLRAGDVKGAIRTALSVDYFVQYRDDALHEVVDHQIAKRDFKSALTMAGMVHNPSRKAAAILKVAVAHAKSGDRKTAADVAARIELSEKAWFAGLGGREAFDYQLPHSWGVNYDFDGAFTVCLAQMQERHMAEVAGAAMTLSQALGQRPDRSYAILFNDIYAEEVIRALARAHAASGDPNDALAWARQIGSDAKVKPEKDDDTRAAVERRVHALIGVAEGILDRSGGVSPRPEP